jgi:hypothetical protein
MDSVIDRTRALASELWPWVLLGAVAGFVDGLMR